MGSLRRLPDPLRRVPGHHGVSEGTVEEDHRGVGVGWVLPSRPTGSGHGRTRRVWMFYRRFRPLCRPCPLPSPLFYRRSPYYSTRRTGGSRRGRAPLRDARPEARPRDAGGPWRSGRRVRPVGVSHCGPRGPQGSPPGLWTPSRSGRDPEVRVVGLRPLPRPRHHRRLDWASCGSAGGRGPSRASVRYLGRPRPTFLFSLKRNFH